MKGRVWHSSGERRVRRPSQLALLPLIVMDARPPSPRYHLPPFSPWELRGVRMEVGREEGCYMAPIFPQFSFCCTPSLRFEDLPFWWSCRSSLTEFSFHRWQIMIDWGLVEALVTCRPQAPAGNLEWQQNSSSLPLTAILARKMGNKHQKKAKKCSKKT